jgi:tRNA (guanine37-N1)-methyltransferase
MRIDILTLFPEMCERVYSESIIGRAVNAGIIEVHARNIRYYTLDKHNRVDDSPYGGGMGMLMQAQPVYDCYLSLCEELGKKPHLIYLSPQGKVLTQKRAKELASEENLALLCGHYEGIDERVLEEIVDEEISIGDYVLTGGELPALVLMDCVARMVDGVLPNEEAYAQESHYTGLLEHPQYTKPYSWNGKEVPAVLISGHHANIEKWKREQSLRRTLERRPELLELAELTEKDREILRKLRAAADNLD